MNTKAKVLATLWFVLIAFNIERSAISLAGPSIMKSLGMSPAQFGIILSSFSLGYFFALIPGGLLVDRYGARLVLIVGPLFWGLFTGATGLVSTLVGFVTVRVLFGIAEGFCNTTFYTLIGNIFEPSKRARAVAICSSAIPLAPAIGGAGIGYLIQAYGWQGMFLAMAVPAFLVGLASHLFLPRGTVRPPVSATAQAEPLAFRSVLKRPSLWLLSLAAAAWNIPYWGYLAWMPSYLALERGIDIKLLGPLSSIPYVFAFFGLLVGGALGSSAALHRHCIQIVVAFFVAGALSLFLAYQAPNVPLALAGLSGAGFFLFGAMGPVGKIVLDLAPESCRATYLAVYTTAGQVGGTAAPVLIGFMVSATGSFAAGFGFMIAAFAVSSACLLALLPFLAAPQPDLLHAA